ncbi:membrane protein, putative [Ketogulonicigenium robustum]|uniref:Probable queuosine precursor transporter n=1 Tax=Ketogulonicigenium robustum TaxID=92947 RepID=A0A1W6P2X6_9RHOB|nr:queuosine precursor transporter [Ketogulonicigenium robustum]ARO15789.1 membrane protein, putative [Ketogulonicigenium robustum]
MKFLPGVLAMAATVVASNILVQFLILDGILTWGAFTYPIAFLINEVTNRVYGPKAARQVVFAGFVTGIICSLIGTQIMLEFGPAVATRTAWASAIAFGAAQLLDIAVFNRLRTQVWWKAPLVSSVCGSVLDTILFFTISFALFITLFGPAADAQIAWASEAVPLLHIGPDMPLWVSLAIADWSVKILIALLALVPFRSLVRYLSARTA